MAGKLVIKNLQLGDNITATQNFVLSENSDGTAKLARGNTGATTQDILTVDANGRVTMPQNVVAFRASMSGLQSVPNNLVTTAAFNTVITNTGGVYDTATGKWTPGVAGWYTITAKGSFSGATGTGDVRIAINGASVVNQSVTIGTVSNEICVSGVIYLTATDYVQVQAYQVTGAANNFGSSNYFSGILIAKA